MRKYRWLVVTMIAAPLWVSAFSGCGEDDVLVPIARDAGKAGDPPIVIVDAGGEWPDTRDAAPPTISGMGAPCEQDQDCPIGLDCVAQTSGEWLGGGPVGGYCTVPCESDFECYEVDVTSSCRGNQCVAGCQLGEDVENKCLGRKDELVCAGFTTPLGFIESFCIPACRNDADCGEDLFCSLANGLCFAEDAVGDPIGAECDPTSEDPTCAAVCLDFGNGYGACTGVCTLGSLGCGVELDEPSGPGDPYCILGARTTADGDLGLCRQRCDCNEDCIHPDDVCLEYEELPPFEEYNARGRCTPRIDPEGNELGGIPCTTLDAGSNGELDAGGQPSGDGGG